MKKIVGTILVIAILVGVTFGINSLILSKNKTELSKVDKSDLIILFMDVWETFPWNYDNADVLAIQENITIDEAKVWISDWLDWWDNEVTMHVQEKVIPLLNYAREHNIEVVFSRNGVRLLPQLENLTFKEPTINRTKDLDAYLKGKNIHTILYAGYATNNCVWGNLTGMKAMAKLGYDVVLIKDASLPANFQVLTYDEVLNEINKVGSITTIKKVMENYK